MKEFINYWVELANSTPTFVFCGGVLLAASALGLGIFLAKCAISGKGSCELGPCRALATFAAVCLCYLGIGFFIVEPINTIQRKNAVNNEQTGYISESETLPPIKDVHVEFDQLYFNTSDKHEPPVQDVTAEDTPGKVLRYTVPSTIILDNGERYQYMNVFYVCYKAPKKRPDWLYSWQEPVIQSWNTNFKF